MSVPAYRAARRRLLNATAWNGWAARRGYSTAAAATRQAQLLELVELRRHRPSGQLAA